MKPVLFAFDLDFTLWDAGGTWCDHTSPPYHKKGEHIYDSERRCIRLYENVREILKDLKNKGYLIAAVSRTFSPTNALELINLFEINQYFDFMEIFPDSKVAHFNNLNEKSKVSFKDMYFFDDEKRNIIDVEVLGVNSFLVENGIKESLVAQILNSFSM